MRCTSRLAWSVIVAVSLAWGGGVLAQSAPAAPAQAAASFTPGQLEQLVAPIALYPDALLSQTLMASTYPSDVAQAVAWAKANQGINGDAAVKAVADQPWDTSVQSLVAFPQVLATMGAKPEWVQDLGDAFLADPNGVMDAVQRLRAKAQAAGNLQSNQQQTVVSEPAPPPSQPVPAGAPPPATQIITIQPANPQVVYVPTFNPAVVYGAWGWPAYPPYYIPPPPGWGFAAGVVTAGIAWGVGIGVTNALWGGMHWGGWGNNNVNINVNRYNNINVNNRINNGNWSHNTANRNGVPYRDNRAGGGQGRYNGDRTAAGRDVPRPTQAGGAQRTAERQRAEQQLSNRVGSENMNRQALQNVDRSTLQNHGGGGQYGGGARDYGNLDRQGARGNNDSAFRGAGDAAQTRQQMDRGAQSRQAMQQHPRPQQSQRPQQAQRPQQSHQMQRSGGGGGAHMGGGGRPAGGGGHAGGGRRR